MKIGFVGAQGCGKTTTAYALAYALKMQTDNALNDVYVLSEVARSCPFTLNENATLSTQLWIFGKQLTREQSSKGKVLVSDRTIMDSFCYGMRISPDIFTHLEPFVKEYLKTYDFIFYLKPNDSFLIEDGIRSTNKTFRDEIDTFINEYLKKLDVQYTTVESGDIDTMIRLIRSKNGRMDK